MDNLMLDLETMGVGVNAPVIAIGAVYFDVESKELGEEFYQTCTLASSINSGGVVDGGTVEWWLKQSQEAREQLVKNQTTLWGMLDNFSEFIGINGPEALVWGNGVNFDNVILRQSYIRYVGSAPFNTFQDRCYRTLKSLYPDIEIQRVGTHHNALDDAKSQALHCIELLERANGS